MPLDISSSVAFQLWALKDHLTQATNPTNLAAVYAALATAGVDVTTPNPVRANSVVDREIVGFWAGAYPVTEVLFLERNVVAQGNNPRGAGSQGASMAQTFARPNTYAVRIRTRVDLDNGFGPDEAQSELLVLAEAIEQWFAHEPHRCLPDNSGNKRVHWAGPPFSWRANPLGLYADDDGQLGQVLAGTITVLGIPRLVSQT